VCQITQAKFKKVIKMFGNGLYLHQDDGSHVEVWRVWKEYCVVCLGGHLPVWILNQSASFDEIR